MSGRSRKDLSGKSGEEQQFEAIYSQDVTLPAELEGLTIVSCLAWRQEQQVYLVSSEEGRFSILKKGTGSAARMLFAEGENLKKYPFSFLPRFISWTGDETEGWLQREYIPGDTLWEIIERGGPLPEKEAGELLCRLCELTGQLHSMKPPVICRDLKPQNIVMTPEGNLFLIDMGTVREYKDGAPYDTVFAGTRQTAAPEQYGYRQTDCRTDIYALGIVYFYLLTGCMDVQKHGAMQSLTSECRQIVEKCTRLSQEERYQSCQELKAAILESVVLKSTVPESVGLGSVVPESVGLESADLESVVPGSTSLESAGLKSTGPGAVIPGSAELESAVPESADPGSAGHGTEQPGKRKPRRWKTAAAAAACGAMILGALGYGAWNNRPYQFQSELIELAVRTQLGKEDGEPVTKEELSQIQRLRICGERILEEGETHSVVCGTHYINQEGDNQSTGTVDDLTDCSYMVNLHTLVMDQQLIKDISPLEKLPLETLSLCGNPITDLSPLEHMDTLKALYVEETNVWDLSVLEGKTSLTELDLHDTQVTDFSPLKDLKLEKLYMLAPLEADWDVITSLPLKILSIHSYSQVLEEKIGTISTLEQLTIYHYMSTTLEPLLELQNLNFLNLYGGNIQSLEGSGQLKRLNSLMIGKTAVTDLTSLEDNQELTWLSLENSLVTDMSPVLDMQALQTLSCSQSQKAELDKITENKITENPPFEVIICEDDPPE